MFQVLYFLDQKSDFFYPSGFSAFFTAFPPGSFSLFGRFYKN